MRTGFKFLSAALVVCGAMSFQSTAQAATEQPVASFNLNFTDAATELGVADPAGDGILSCRREPDGVQPRQLGDRLLG